VLVRRHERRSVPSAAFGELQWGGLPHAQIEDIEVLDTPSGYEL